MPRIIAKVKPGFVVPEDVKPTVVKALRGVVAKHFSYKLKNVEFIWDFLEEATNVPNITFDVMFSYKIVLQGQQADLSTIFAALLVLDVTTDKLKASLSKKLEDLRGVLPTGNYSAWVYPIIGGKYTSISL